MLAHLDEQIRYLNTVKDIAADPDNKNQFGAAKYLYELFSGNKSNQTTFNIAIQNNHPQAIRTESSLKLIENVDAEVIKEIAND
jgi:hypothetical protein